MSLATSLDVPTESFREEGLSWLTVWEGAVLHGDAHNDRNVQQ